MSWRHRLETDLLRVPHRMMLLAVFLTGLAWLLFLPPFEGFDEEAHYSSIAQIANTGRVPVYGTDLLDAAVEAYPGPHPYANAPPFEDGRGVTYREFRSLERSGPHRVSPPAYTPGSEPNWQAQHPPLYYLLLAPVKAVVSDLGWTSQFLVLRLISWAFAVGGLVIAVEALARRPGLLPPGGAVVAAAWPFVFPQFIPEMARLGNDSLCLLLLAVALVFVLRIDKDPNARDSLALAAALAAGLWTKAFFLPLTAGIALWFAWRIWLARADRTKARTWVKSAAMSMGGAGLVGGLWYGGRFLATGDVTGGDEFVRLGQDADFLSGLLAHFQLVDFLRGVAAIAGSFGWAGTWSLVRPSEVLILGPVLLMAWVLIRWALQARQLEPVHALPVFVAAPMVAGLIYHLLVRISAGEGGIGTPGWYLHILAPVVMIALAWGWRGSMISKGLAMYVVGFTAYVWALQLSLFSGCAAKLGEQKTFTFEGATCFVDVGQLNALGHPLLGATALLMACAAGGWAVFTAWRND